MSSRETARRVAIARGEAPADLVLRGGRALNVFTGELVEADVALCGEMIAGVGRYRGNEEIDLDGAIVLPGFIDGHIHIESTMLSPTRFAEAVSPHGTTTVIADPHEIANVSGLAGVRYMLADAAGGPVDIYLTAPSCVPATHLETSGAELGPAEVERMLAWPGVLGLAEMMNFPGVLLGVEEVMLKLAAAEGRPVDGHAPGLSGADLQAYATAGPRSEHEATTLEEAREKLAAGMWIMIREGSAARNLRELAPLLQGEGADRCLLVSDDRNTFDLLADGHLDNTLRQAVALGAPAHRAVRAVTLNAATRFGLNDRGAVAPGYRADLAVVSDLEDFEVQLVLKSGRRARDLFRPPTKTPAALRVTCDVGDLTAASFAIRCDGTATVRVIEIVPGQVVTRHGQAALRSREGELHAQAADDLLKLTVIERHHGTGHVGLGFVRGLGLRRGAMASTVAHDSHNLVIAGASDQAMLRAAEAICSAGGGQAVATDDEVLALLPLPIGGLMSEAEVASVGEGVRALTRAARGLGCELADPMMTLSFLALPVIPELRLTDRGLVDVAAFEVVPLIIE
jgi:adenine deaminase